MTTDPGEADRLVRSALDAVVDHYKRQLQDRDAEIAAYRKWVNDLHTGMWINCVYCGHRYGPNVPADDTHAPQPSMADALAKHVYACNKHPMSALVAALRQISTDLGWLVSLAPSPPDEVACRVMQMQAVADEALERHNPNNFFKPVGG